MTEQTAQVSWTCSRCAVTASWMPDTERSGQPATWRREGDDLYCLGCRRALAGEAALDGVDEPSVDERARIRRAAVLDFEVRRVPGNSNGEIARACRSSVPAVVKARRRVGLAEPAA
jgi:hypothetical protein